MHPEPGDIEGTYCSRTDWPTGVAEPGPVTMRPIPALAASPSLFRTATVFSTPTGHRPTRVSVYDAFGRRVRVLDPAPGLVWDGTDAYGRRLPAGVYVGRADGLLPARVILGE